jgi:hypothetical protein
VAKTWNPAVEISPAEAKILKLCQKQKLWGFLRKHRHLLLDEEMRLALRGMYAASGRGKPVCPERLALAFVLQVAFHVPDHEVPTLTAVDRRWRMVLDCLDEELDETAFSQGSVFHFRERAREHGFMRRLLEKTVVLAEDTRGFSHKRLRVMIDSSPLMGAGRVEDTFNLIGRAIAQLVAVAAVETGREEVELVEQLELTVVSAKSVKAALDVDWRLPTARAEALQILLGQFDRLRSWLSDQFTAERLSGPPLGEAVALVERLVEQDTEPDPDDPTGGRRVRHGGKDRQISISDPDMRHGRKSSKRPFAGYKRHLSVDADIPGLVRSVRVLPANVREYAAAEPLLVQVEERHDLAELHFDRGYLPAEGIHRRRAAGLRVVSKPPTPPKSKDGRFGKADFDIDVAGGLVTCPAGAVQEVKQGKSRAYAAFSAAGCRGCDSADRCLPASGRKVVTLHHREALHQQMAAELATFRGRADRRERVLVEHALARLGAVQGTRARYRGLAKNQTHAEACAAVANLYVLGRLLAEAA